MRMCEPDGLLQCSLPRRPDSGWRRSPRRRSGFSKRRQRRTGSGIRRPRAKRRSPSLQERAISARIFASRKAPGWFWTSRPTTFSGCILDGKLVAEGNDWTTAQHVKARIGPGPHALAVKAANEAVGPAGFLLHGGVLPLGQGVPIQTNSTWRSSQQVPEGQAWTSVEFDDSGWVRALDLGVVGSGPWGHLAFDGDDPSGRFRVPEGFAIDTAARPSVTGSVVAFTFDFDGRPCVSIERGPIARLIDDDKDGRYDRRQPITPQMSNCQGLSFIRRHLYAVGQGPSGTGLYRLDDGDNDGVFEKAEAFAYRKEEWASTGRMRWHLDPMASSITTMAITLTSSRQWTQPAR